MTKLIYGLIYSLIGHILTFIQIQGILKYEFLQNNKWISILASMPISWLFILATQHLVDYFSGEIWPSRLIGFSVGAIVFTIMSIILFSENISLKTGICLILAITILTIQFVWK